MLRYNFFILLSITNVSLMGMCDLSVIPLQHKKLITGDNRYNKLGIEFGCLPLSNALNNYNNDHDKFDANIKKWSHVVRNYIEEQKRYFFVNIMLYSQRNTKGLEVLYNHYQINSDNKPIATDQEETVGLYQLTPHGVINTKLSLEDYQKAMEIPEDIRDIIFAKDGCSPLVLVEKKNVGSNLNNDLIKRYPILKTHDVRSLILKNNNETPWLYNIRSFITKWVSVVSIMILLLKFLICEKIITNNTLI
ncbi:MAG TPA: hypothetical protein VLB80_02830 [Candidatus Babeliales bacterium]|nr:hypothetical protein [Candidatus Babeliales bacterium]